MRHTCGSSGRLKRCKGTRPFHKYCTRPEICATPVGAGLPAKGPDALILQAAQGCVTRPRH
ncbi:hypothetical protein D0O09_04385 [Pseudomonas putida]|nr:hypothetical protein D0O09_04385 [Pseudomonas putida]